MMDYLIWIISAFSIFALEVVFAVESVDLDKDPLPCLGLQRELSNHEGIVACRSRWEGDISSDDAMSICRSGWKICNWEDRDVLMRISWYEATHIRGCYVINAAHDGDSCASCGGKAPKAEMAAIGADCLAYNRTKSSCFGNGKIDASDSRVVQYTPCHYSPWITGVLCCRKRSEHPKLDVKAYVSPSRRVMSGTAVTMQCQATGPLSVRYSWYRNNHLLKAFDDHPTVTIKSPTVSDSGEWFCRANYSHGNSDSPPIYLRVIEWSDGSTKGCKNESHGKTVASSNGNVVLCGGSWRGHVKTASKNLCARGWKVCSYRNRPALYSILWEENLNISGCYAYNAASSKYFPCTRCSRRNTGNRMAGIGSGCVNQQQSGYSCLGQGRIDVFSKGSASSKHKRTRRACRYTEGITTGVVCCKTNKQREKPCRCKNGGVCSGKRICICRSGYTGKRCQKKVDLR